MSDSTAIAVISDLYEYMSVSSSADEALLKKIIDRKTEQFTQYCEITSFFINDYVEYADGNERIVMFVKNYPLNSITEIAIDSGWQWGSDSVVDASEYRVVDNSYIVYKNVFSCGIQNVRISYNAGYSTIPLDIKEALIEEVYRTYTRRKEPDVNIKTLTDGSIHLAPSGLLQSTRNVLDKYKRTRAV